MSKFLKFIVHFIVICTILCVVALAVPPFFGVTTVIRDDSAQGSNLPMGSVTYAIPVKTEEASIGMSILVNDAEDVYHYNIASLDLNNHMGTAVDPDAMSGEPIYVTVGNYVPRIVITVPFLGYLLVATESIEGLIVLGLAVLFLIILYVIAELWKKDSAEDEDDYEDVRLKSRKELRREEKAREKRMKAEDREFLREEKQRQKEERKNRKIIKTGGFVDEIYEDEMEREDEMPRRRVRNVQSATSEAHELLKREIAAATAEDSEEEPPVRRAKPVSEERASRVRREAPEQKRQPAQAQKMAVPRYSAAQLAERAKQEGDAPDIIKDDITEVTLFDYSDIIGGDEEP